MTETKTDHDDSQKFQPWEGSSVFVEQGRHWSSAFIWLSASLLTGSLVWAFTAKIDQTITVRGQLQPSGSVKEIEAPSAGVVHDILVSEGQTVTVGQDLLVVQAKGLASRRKSLKQRLILLEYEVASLQTIIDRDADPIPFSSFPSIAEDSDPSFVPRLRAARNQTLSIRTQLKQVATRTESRKASYELQQKIADDMKPLFESGGISRNAYLQQLNRLQELKAEVSTLQSERSRLLGLISSNINNLNRQIISLTAELDSIVEAIGFRTVKSPFSGTIFDLRVSSSSVVSSSEVLLKIVPENKLEASVRILDSDIGFVKLGQAASVSVDSFPSGEFGYINGTLSNIGIDVLPPDRENPMRYFPAVINLKEQTVLSGTRTLNLQSGMGISANIKLRSRPVITVLTDIFTKQSEGIKRFR